MSIHFSEILLILLVALLVIKPERLPEVAYTLGRWFRWLQTMTTKIKNVFETPEMGKYSFHEPLKKPLEHE
jgi:Sec-independent protein translocase protein TatA